MDSAGPDPLGPGEFPPPSDGAMPPPVATLEPDPDGAPAETVAAGPVSVGPAEPAEVAEPAGPAGGGAEAAVEPPVVDPAVQDAVRASTPATSVNRDNLRCLLFREPVGVIMADPSSRADRPGPRVDRSLHQPGRGLVTVRDGDPDHRRPAAGVLANGRRVQVTVTGDADPNRAVRPIRAQRGAPRHQRPAKVVDGDLLAIPPAGVVTPCWSHQVLPSPSRRGTSRHAPPVGRLAAYSQCRPAMRATRQKHPGGEIPDGHRARSSQSPR